MSVSGTAAVTKRFGDEYTLGSVLDVGCGRGALFQPLLEKADKVHGIDLLNPPRLPERVTYEQTTIQDYTPEAPFDAAICSHVVEHMPDTEQFLNRFFSFIKDEGAWCIIWPPLKHQIVGGHVHIFNYGLMLYNIIRTGIDCSSVKMFRSRYSEAIMGTKATFDVPKLVYDRGDIEILSEWFPFDAKQNFHGFKGVGRVEPLID